MKKFNKTFENNKLILEFNRHSILEIIQEKERTVKEILLEIKRRNENVTSDLVLKIKKRNENILGRTALDNHLKYFIEENQVDMISKDRKTCYRITDKGKDYVQKFILVKSFFELLFNSNNKTFDNYSELGVGMSMCNLPWGIQSHLLIKKELEKKKYVNPNDIEQIERILFEKIKHNLTRRDNFRLKISEKDVKEKKETPYFEVGFKINLDHLNKSIREQSLKKYDEFSVKEISEKFESQSDEALDYVAEHEDELDLVEVKKEEKL